MTDIDGVSYAAFLVPGLTMLSVLGQSIANASFGIYMPRFVGTIYEVLSAPMSPIEIVPWRSKMGFQVVPPFVVFQSPPEAVAT